MYDPLLAFIHQVETHCRLHSSTLLKVYFLIYDESLEHQQYNTTVSMERDAYMRLISTKASLAMPSMDVLLSEYDAL